jgi:hypothetical protein
VAGSLKEFGIVELNALRKRVKRQYALGRINRGDHDVLIKKLDEIEAYIIKMPEGAQRRRDFEF